MEKVLQYKTYFTFFSRTSLTIMPQYSLNIDWDYRERPPKLKSTFLLKSQPITDSIFHNTKEITFFLTFDYKIHKLTFLHKPDEDVMPKKISEAAIRKFKPNEVIPIYCDLENETKYEIEGAIDLATEGETLELDVSIVEKENKIRLFV